MNKLKLFTLFAIAVLTASLAVFFIPLGHASMYQYQFQGLYDEDTGNFTGAVNVTAIFNSGYGYFNQNFTVSGTYLFNATALPQEFVFQLAAGYHREYWLRPADVNINNIYIFNSTNPIQLTQIIFRDQTNSLTNHTLCVATKYVNGILYAVERRFIDTTKTTLEALEYGTTYQISVIDSVPQVNFGNVVIGTNPIYLLVNGLQFPSGITLTYQYVRMYGTRVFSVPYGTISLSYQDVTGTTTSVSYTIYYVLNNSVAYQNTISGSSVFVDTFSSAVNNTDYYLQATITTTQFGMLSWNQVFPRTYSTAPFDLSFLGSWPIASSAIIPMILIVFAFGSFSVLNAYMGAFCGAVTACVVTYLGWISITSGALLTVVGFAVLIAITAAKRRLWT